MPDLIKRSEEGKGLENTKRVVPVIMRSNLSLMRFLPLRQHSTFPPRVGDISFTKPFPGSSDRTDIAARDTWDASELERLIQVIPHMSGRTSRRLSDG